MGIETPDVANYLVIMVVTTSLQHVYLEPYLIRECSFASEWDAKACNWGPPN